MKNGDVVFFKKAKDSSARRAPEVMFKGHGFGILLGHVPPFAKNPPAAFVIGQLGSIGYLSFDDVIEFLGQEAGATCVAKFEDKYMPKAADPNAPELPLAEQSMGPEHDRREDEIVTPPARKLVGINGQPISSNPPEDQF
jgi:hypothetical protein